MILFCFNYTFRLLKDAMNSSVINPNYTPYFVVGVAARSKIGREKAWLFVKQNWKQLTEKYGNNIFLLGRLLSGVLSQFSSEEYLIDIENFFKDKHDLGSGKKALEQSILEIKFNTIYKNILKNSSWFQ